MPEIIDMGFFERPGFSLLYDTWSEVFERNPNSGQAVIPAEDAVKMLKDARVAAAIEVNEKSGLYKDDALALFREVNTLERIAVSYAIGLPIKIDEETRNAGGW